MSRLHLIVSESPFDFIFFFLIPALFALDGFLLNHQNVSEKKYLIFIY